MACVSGACHVVLGATIFTMLTAHARKARRYDFNTLVLLLVWLLIMPGFYARSAIQPCRLSDRIYRCAGVFGTALPGGGGAREYSCACWAAWSGWMPPWCATLSGGPSCWQASAWKGSGRPGKAVCPQSSLAGSGLCAHFVLQSE